MKTSFSQKSVETQRRVIEETPIRARGPMTKSLGAQSLKGKDTKGRPPKNRSHRKDIKRMDFESKGMLNLGQRDWSTGSAKVTLKAQLDFILSFDITQTKY